MTPSYPLEPTGDEMRRVMRTVTERVVDHITSLPTQPSFHVEGAEALARALIEPMPDDGAPLEGLLETVFDRAAPTSFNTAGPGYLAYIPGGGLFHSAVADFIASAINRYVGVWLAAPGLSQLEANVLAWFAEIVRYPAEARGILTSGGSLSLLSALVVARHDRLDGKMDGATLYISDQGHHAIGKAAHLAGFHADAIRVVATDDDFRLRLDVLEDMVRADRAAGKRPFLVVGSAGTVNTGVVDDLAGMADVAARESLWFHIDAAYGGFFMMTERGQQLMRGMDRADSITLDPHKGLFLPYGTGSLLVRNGEALRLAHAADAAYLPVMRDGEEFMDFCQYSPELSRPFRGLGVWLPFKLVGARVFREQLDEKLDLARWAADQLRQLPALEIVAEPELSLLAFRLAPHGMAAGALNDLNRRFLERINARRRVYITATTVRGVFMLRICILSFRTHADRVAMGIDDIRAAAAEVLA